MDGGCVNLKRWVAAAAIAGLLPAVAACGAADRIMGRDPATKPQDPMAAPIHVGTTSARARYCGFVFDAGNLRASFLSSRAMTAPPDQMQKMERAYDYSYKRVSESLQGERNYCSKDRVEMIRRDLNRYLAGDFSAPAGKVE